MKQFYLIVFALVASSSAVLANNLPWCAYNYRYDSYVLGLQYSYTAELSRPLRLEQSCWDLGKAEGRRLKAHWNSQSCQAAYNHGKKLGLEADFLILRQPDECSQAGHSVGLVMLSQFARKNANSPSSPCGEAYREGKSDARNMRAGTMRSTRRLNHCYRTGYDDFLALRQ